MKKLYFTLLFVLSISIVQSQNVTVNIRALIQGFYLGLGTMVPVIGPVSQPNICDSMTVNLLDTVGPAYNVLYSVKSVISTTGYGAFSFPNAVLNGTYFIQLVHRNALTVFSKYPVLVDSISIFYDFTVLPLQLCNTAFSSFDGFALIYSGDIDQNGFIDTVDLELLVNAFGTIPQFGYLNADLNGDSVIDILDIPALTPNLDSSNNPTPLWCGHPNSCLHIGINEPDKPTVEFICFPNPSIEQINLSYTLDYNSSVGITVNDCLGRIIFSEKKKRLPSGIHKEILNIETLNSGLYIVKLTVDENEYQQKFIRQ